jgi:predicted aspartyl protease
MRHGLSCATLALFLLLLMLPTASIAQGTWPEACKLHRVAHFPITIVANHIVIPILLNGENQRFIFDTGGYASSVTSTAVTELSLKTHHIDEVKIRDLSGKAAKFYAIASTLGLGSMVGKDVPLMVIPPLSFADGIIGPDLLRNFDVEIDFGNGTLNLFRPHPCDDDAVYWTKNYSAVSFYITHDGHVSVPVELDGKDTHAVLDTGAQSSVITMLNLGRIFDLDKTSPGIVPMPMLVGALGGQVDSYSYPFKTLQLGPVTVPNPKILITDGRDYLKYSDSSLIIGLNELRLLHLYIAYHEGKVYFSDVNAR